MDEGILEPELFNVPVVVFDLETTGLSPYYGDEIVEIGALKAVGGEAVAEFHTLVNPLRPISAGASAVNGITNDMVRGAPLITDALPAFLEFIADMPLVAHNAQFDLAFVGWKLAELAMPNRNNPVLDTIKLARTLHPDFGAYSLSSLVERMQIGDAPRHRAMSDTYATLALFARLLAPHAAAGGLTVARALELQGGGVPWPAIRREDIIFTPESPLEITLQCAIERDETVVIQYKSSYNQTTVREIKPLKIYRQAGNSYLTADCYLRNEQRTFRLDRIASFGHGAASSGPA